MPATSDYYSICVCVCKFKGISSFLQPKFHIVRRGEPIMATQSVEYTGPGGGGEVWGHALRKCLGSLWLLLGPQKLNDF